MQNSRYQAIETYIQKIAYQSSQITSLENSLLESNMRLRSAQDLNIKYEMLIKELEKQKKDKLITQRSQHAQANEIICMKIAERDRYWSEKVTQLETQIEKHYQGKIGKLKEQIQRYEKNARTQKNSSNSKFDDVDILNFKCKKLQKQNQHYEETIIKMKIQAQKNQEQQKNRVRQECQLENKQKQQNQRNIYRQKIQQLTQKINDIQTQLEDTKAKISPERERLISQLKAQVDNVSIRANKQIQSITAHFSMKNKEWISQLNQKTKKQEEMRKEEENLRACLKKIEDQLFERERENSQEALGIKQKMSKIRQQQIASMKSQLQYHQNDIRNQRSKWDKVIEDKDKQLERVTAQIQQERQRHKDDRTKLKAKMSQLKQKLRHYENQQGNDTINFMQSLKELEIKEADFANYENSVTFLSRQLKKALNKIQQKNIQINRLIKQLNTIQEQNNRELTTLKNKFKKDRGSYLDRISRMQNQIKNLNEQIRKRQKQIRRKQKDDQTQVHQIKIENKSLKQMIDELQKDYSRVLKNKQAADNSYRSERQKGFTSKSDLTVAKQQKWLELERQKNQLDVMFKEKQQQMKIKFQLQKQKLRIQRDELKAQLQVAKVNPIEVCNDPEKKQTEHINKQNLRKQNEKKLATLNLQIALTQNIYDSLMNASSNKTKIQDRNFEKISQQISESDGQMKTLEISPRYQSDDRGSNNKGQKMLFSFNPKQI